MSSVWRRHLDSARALETVYEAVRAGFVALALEKSRRATPFVAEARALRVQAQRAKTPDDLLGIVDIQPALLAAAGLSIKAAGHIEDVDRQRAIRDLIREFLEPAGASFVEELVFRFLLTRGDALGGSMRNVAGFLAQRKLVRTIIASLRLANRECRWTRESTKPAWEDLPDDSVDIEPMLRGLSWTAGEKRRMLLCNITPPMLKNNVDVVLLDAQTTNVPRALVGMPSAYIALGELKGGIDPAGADAHWKTARSALGRIREAFSSCTPQPQLFFVGAAIERKMADEIWAMLGTRRLDNAANLTDDSQLNSVVAWLCSL